MHFEIIGLRKCPNPRLCSLRSERLNHFIFNSILSFFLREDSLIVIPLATRRLNKYVSTKISIFPNKMSCDDFPSPPHLFPLNISSRCVGLVKESHN